MQISKYLQENNYLNQNLNQKGDKWIRGGDCSSGGKNLCHNYQVAGLDPPRVLKHFTRLTADRDQRPRWRLCVR